jgi:dolichol-phosphate mannosyltransferase
MTYRAFISGCKIVEESIVFTERRAGQSKMSRSVILESALMPWRLKFGRARLAQMLK